MTESGTQRKEQGLGTAFDRARHGGWDVKSRYQQLVVVVLLVFWSMVAGSAPSVSNGRAILAANQVADEDVTTLFANIESGLDGYGRPTIFRLTIQPFAGIGPEDLLPPFTAYVEAGAFVYRNPSGDYTDLKAGDFVSVVSGDDYAIRNQLITGERPTLIVMLQSGSCWQSPDWTCEPQYLPYDILCEDAPCRKDIRNTLLFNQQKTVWRLMDVIYSLQYVTLGDSEPYTPVDPGGDGETIQMMVGVDVGTVQTSTGESYSAGDSFIVDSDQTVLESGSEGAELFLLRVAKWE